MGQSVVCPSCPWQQQYIGLDSSFITKKQNQTKEGKENDFVIANYSFNLLHTGFGWVWPNVQIVNWDLFLTGFYFKYILVNVKVKKVKKQSKCKRVNVKYIILHLLIHQQTALTTRFN